MKIEKVNEHQIRCTLTREDLANRELKISELAYGTEKAKSLFRDMMQQAAFECGFEAEDIPLMIEAIPLNAECIVLIVTKVEDPDELDTRFSKFAPSVHEENSYEDEHEEMMETFADGADEVLNLLRRMNSEESSEDSAPVSGTEAQKPSGGQPPKDIPANQAAPVANQLFSFASIHEVTRLAHIAAVSYHGMNSLYKDEASGANLLLLSSADMSPADFNRICNLASEYGRTEKAARTTSAHLEEHSEPLIKDHALEVLSRL